VAKLFFKNTLRRIANSSRVELMPHKLVAVIFNKLKQPFEKLQLLQKSFENKVPFEGCSFIWKNLPIYKFKL